MCLKIIFLLFFSNIVLCRIVPQRVNRLMSVGTKLNSVKSTFPKSFNKNETKEFNAMKHTINLNGSLHYKINSDQGKVASSTVKRFERDFRKLISMVGTKYIFKRGFYWRTWRKVKYSNGEDKIVFYKCSNPVSLNSSDCQSVGLWNIDEEKPPCPYELFSMVNDYKFCGASYTQFLGDLSEACPATIKLFDLKPTCNNPIITNWQITRTHQTPARKTNNNIICGDKKICNVTTVYTIMHKQVVFRIINSSGDVIYSRIMRPHSNNYICVENCGHYNATAAETTTKVFPNLKTDINTLRQYNDTYKYKTLTLRKPKRHSAGYNNVRFSGSIRNSSNMLDVLKKIDHVKKLEEEYMKLYTPITVTPKSTQDDTFSYEEYDGYA